MSPLVAPVHHLIIAPTWAPVRRAATVPGRLVMTLSQLWRALDASHEASLLRLHPLASDWQIDACLTHLETPHVFTVGAIRLAAAAIQSLRAANVSAEQLRRAADDAGAGHDVVALLTLYESALREHAPPLDDMTAATRGALAVAAQAHWPRPLHHVRHIEFRHGAEWIGRDLALVLAMAKSGRRVTVHADATTQQRDDACSLMAAPYEDALVGPLESSGLDSLDVVWSGAEPALESEARVDIHEVAPHLELTERVAFDIGQAIARGIRPEHIAVVLPASAPPLWRRRAATRRLRALLRDAKIPHQGGPVARLGDTLVGLVCLDALTLAHEWQTSPGVKELSLGAWGRLLFALGEVAESPAWWPHPTLDERVSLDGLKRRLVQQATVPPESVSVLLDAAQNVLESWVKPLVDQPIADGLPLYLSMAERLCEKAQGGEADAPRAMATLEDTLVALADAWSLGPKDKHAHAAHLLYVRRTLERAPLDVDGADGGVVLLRPEDLPGARFEAVFVVGANEQVWFRPGTPNPWLPEALVRTLARSRLAVLTPAASVAGERMLLPRDRMAWLWHHARRAATREFVAYLLLDDSGEEKNEPACEALLGGTSHFSLALPVATEPPVAQLTPTRRSLAESAHEPRQAAVRPALLTPASQPRLEAAVVQTEQTAGHVDELARCKFRYFAGVLLKLTEKERPTPTPSPRFVGSAMHRALKDAVENEMARRRPTGKTLPLSDEDCEAALKVAEVDFFLHDAERYVPTDRVHPHLLGATRSHVWAATREQLIMAWQKEAIVERHCELSFGDNYKLPALELKEPEGTRRLRIRGAIDRIDVSATMCTTLDYKSSLQRRIEHRHLQLPTYLLVAGRDIAPGLPLRAGWLALSGNESQRLKLAKDLEGDFRFLETRIATDAWRRVWPLLEGDIQADPAPASSCRACSFADLCQVSQLDDETEGEEDVT